VNSESVSSPRSLFFCLPEAEGIVGADCVVLHGNGRWLNNDLRESRRVQYATAKTAYQAAIKKDKNNVLEETLHCNITDKSME